MHLLLSAATVKITLLLCPELMSAKHSLPTALCLQSDRYHAFSISYRVYLPPILPSYFRTAAQLGIFRKTGIKAQFRIDWLRSKYRTSEWCYNVEFLRVEGYTPGEYLQLTTKFCKTYEVFAHFFSLLLQEQNIRFLIQLPKASFL